MSDEAQKRSHADAFDNEPIDLDGEDEKLKQLVEFQMAAAAATESRDSEKLAKLRCAICLDSPTDLSATLCGHVFCHTCLMETLAAGEQMQPKQSKCPICRHRVNKKDIRPLEIKIKVRPRQA